VKIAPPPRSIIPTFLLPFRRMPPTSGIFTFKDFDGR
jgi:hypothetical protein